MALRALTSPARAPVVDAHLHPISDDGAHVVGGHVAIGLEQVGTMQSAGHNSEVSWQTAAVSSKPEYDVLAPDGSEIRLLVQVGGGSLVHCTLRPGGVTRAVQHRTVEEVWFCVAGNGQLWRTADGSPDEITDLQRGVAVTIPLGARFQFRATGAEPLEIVITTLPPWPGADEAIYVEGRWPPTA